MAAEAGTRRICPAGTPVAVAPGKAFEAPAAGGGELRRVLVHYAHDLPGAFRQRVVGGLEQIENHDGDGAGWRQRRRPGQ